MSGFTCSLNLVFFNQQKRKFYYNFQFMQQIKMFNVQSLIQFYYKTKINKFTYQSQQQTIKQHNIAQNFSQKMRQSTKSKNQQKQINLPSLQNSAIYHNQYQNYEEDLFQYKSKNTIKQNENNQWNQIQNKSQLYNSQVLEQENNQPNQVRSIEIQTGYGGDFYSQLTEKQQQQYYKMTAQQIRQDLKQMRLQFQDMNKKLNEMLDIYHMSKNQLKQPAPQSQPEFYQKQISTNERIEESQIQQLKKLSKMQSDVKDKDILLQLQQLVFQFQKEIHQKKKDEHHSKVKNHKLDRKLDEQIVENQQNGESNYVKILKLQIVFYIKKQHDLKFHDEQLDHSKKLLIQNDQTLTKKLNQYIKIAEQKKLEIKVNKPYLEMKKRYYQLIQQINLLKKKQQAIQRSNDIFEQREARQALEYKTQITKVINPEIERCEIQTQDMNIKIKAVMERYGLLDSSLEQVKHRFSDDITFHSRYDKEDKSKLTKSSLKPNFRINVKMSTHNKSIDYEGINTSRTVRKLSEKQDKTHSDAKFANYNDKNMTINFDQNNEQKLNHRFKPKINLRNISKTIQTHKPSTFNTQISPILLKPRINLSKK